MKAIINRISIKLVSLALISLVLLLNLVSCAKKIPFQTSVQVPAARGNVTYKKDKNNNYEIKLQITYLAEPNRLQPPKTAYVVWLDSNQNSNPINLGQIISGKRFSLNPTLLPYAAGNPIYFDKFLRKSNFPKIFFA